VADDADAPPVLRAAWTIAEGCGARVALLHVTDDPSRAGWAARARDWLTASGVPPARSAMIIRQGDRVRGILDVTRHVRAEVIAIGARGAGAHEEAEGGRHRDDRDRIERTLARTAPCSVLVVPHPTDVPAPPREPRATATCGWHRREMPPRTAADGHDGRPPAAAALCAAGDAA
jgi:hypothetical protein